MEPEDAERIARILIRRYLGRSWHFAWGKLKNADGECDYEKRELRFDRRNTKASNMTEFMDTVAHEIAHGIVFRKGHTGHGRLWRKVARTLGANTGPIRAPRLRAGD